MLSGRSHDGKSRGRMMQEPRSHGGAVLNCCYICFILLPSMVPRSRYSSSCIQSEGKGVCLTRTALSSCLARSVPLMMMICLVCATLGASVPSGCYSSLGVSPRSRRGCVVGVLPCQWLTLARFLHPDVMLPLAPWVGCAKGRSPTHLPSPRRSHASIRIGEVVLSNEK